MKKDLIIMVAAFTVLTYASSQSGNFRVVKSGTEDVVTAIRMEPGESIKICLQGKVGVDSVRWVSVAGGWYVPGPLKHPLPNTECIDVGYDIAIDDTIRITFSDSEFIAIPLLIKYADSNRVVFPELLNSTKGIKCGDTLSFRMVVLTHDSLMPGVYCSDSIIYRMYSEKGEDTLSELVVKGEKRKTGQMIRQCFNNGQDTVKIILKDTTTTGLNYLSFRLGNHGGISEKFMVAANSSVIGKNCFTDRNRNAIFRNGKIQFKTGITTPVTVKVVTVKGEIVHTGIYIPAKNAVQQYSIPSSLPNGYYLLLLNEKNGKRSIYSFMSMK
jgi:hypothetical protein